MYKVVWESSAEKGLVKVDKKIAQKIKKKVENYLVKDPIGLGKPLTGQYKGLYRYKFKKDYRVIYQIKDKELLIIIVKVGHRREVY